MESQPQNPEFRNNLENFLQAYVVADTEEKSQITSRFSSTSLVVVEYSRSLTE